MVKKIKFPLEMSEDAKVRTLEELREHFGLERVIAYYMDGKLVTWLNDRYYENEVSQISQLDKDAPDFKKKLCEILGVAIKIDSEIDLEMIEKRNAKLNKLKQFTGDSEIIRNVESVAFDQEELSDLLDDDVSPIYLCGERFIIPLSKEKVTYIGVNSPVAVINSKTVVDFDAKNIRFKNILFNEEYLNLIQNKKVIEPQKNVVIKGIYKTSMLFDYMMDSNDKAASAQLFNIIHSGMETFEFDMGKIVKAKTEMLQEAKLNKTFEKFAEKM